MPKVYGTARDWPAIDDNSAAAWNQANKLFFQNAERLRQAIERFSDARLEDTVPGREYDFYHLFHGNVQHALYHGGQIAQLKKELAR